MASIFLCEKRGAGLWWIKARSAQTRTLVRASLETRDPAMDELLRRRIELELELRRPELAGLALSPKLLADLELAVFRAFQPSQNGEGDDRPPEPPQVNALPVAEAVTAYYRQS